MLKAGALLYAIYVCLIIAILSGGLVYIFTINKTWATRQDIKVQLIDRCDACFDYFLSNSKAFSTSNSEQIDLFDDGLLCEFRKERWGMYATLIGKAFFGKDTISKNFIVGHVTHQEPLALYLCDFGEELKISGTTLIKGNLKLPKKRYKVINILGNQQLNYPTIDGTIEISSQNLPQLISPTLEYPQNALDRTLEKLKGKPSIFRPFGKETIVVHLDKRASLDRMKMKGNFIIKSLDTLYINKTSEIEDVIIQAPKVVIEKGFEGSIQVYADKEVVIESDVKLRYPSCIVIDASTRDYEKEIKIAEDVAIYGGIVMNGSSFREKQHNYITMDENSLVVGDVYCNGMMELKGSIIGSLYTHKLRLENKSSIYADVILNGVVDATELPKDFVRLPLFENTGEKRFERVKNIQ